MEGPPESLHIDVMQQGCELCLAPASGRLVHPGKIGWQGCPALRPDLRLPARTPFRPGPSLRTPRTIFLRRHHQYYTPVRHPALSSVPDSGCPLSDTPFGNQPKAPAGLPGFQQYPFIRDVAFDPGGARTSRANDGLHAAFNVANRLSLRDLFFISWLNPTPHMTAVYASDRTLP